MLQGSFPPSKITKRVSLKWLVLRSVWAPLVMKKYPFLKKVGSKQKRIIFKCQFGPLWVMKNDHFLKRSFWAPLEWRERDHFLKKSKFSIYSFTLFAFTAKYLLWTFLRMYPGHTIPVMMILWMCVVIYRTNGRLRPASVPQIGVLLQHIISYGTHQPASCPFALMMIVITIMIMTQAHHNTSWMI